MKQVGSSLSRGNGSIGYSAVQTQSNVRRASRAYLYNSASDWVSVLAAAAANLASAGFCSSWRKKSTTFTIALEYSAVVETTAAKMLAARVLWLCFSGFSRICFKKRSLKFVSPVYHCETESVTFAS